MEGEVRDALDRWEPRIEVIDVDFDLAGVDRGELLINIAYRLRATNHLRNLVYPFYIIPAERRVRETPRDRARRPPLPGPRLRGAAADQPRLPGVDRAQRLRPRHHADRAVRVDDGDDDLPAQPRAGQAPRGAARAARHPARRPDAPRAPTCASGSPPRPRSRSRSRRRDRGRDAAHGQRGVDRVPVDEDFTIPARARRPTSCSAAARSRTSASPTATARPKGADQLAFGEPPAVGDALYLGFDESLGRLLLAGRRRCSQARGAGVDPEDPPLRWEVSQRESGWARRTCSTTSRAASTTAPAPSSCSCPERSAASRRRPARALAALPARRPHAPRRAATTYTHPPEIYSITAAPIGALIPAAHAARVEGELLGRERRHARPALPAAPRARCSSRRRARRSRCRTRSPATGRPGSCARTSSARPRRPPLRARPVSGDVELGPAVRAPDGGWRQYGACRRRAPCCA